MKVSHGAAHTYRTIYLSHIKRLGNTLAREDEILKLLSRRRVLIVLDHCDAVQSDVAFRNFVGQLLDQTKAVKILLTSRRTIMGLPGFPSQAHALRPMKWLEAARLFLRLSPHYRHWKTRQAPAVGFLEARGIL